MPHTDDDHTVDEFIAALARLSPEDRAFMLEVLDTMTELKRTLAPEAYSAWLKAAGALLQELGRIAPT